MNVEEDADGSLDPRIQIELENLNNATDDINKLETELDEAHTAFRQLLSESTRRLKEIADKLGSSCIEKARCYYEALEVARQAQVQCQQQAQLFQRASEIHAAAKETVALAEARFMSHQHEWNFDQAWQDMLNHATIKVMDAENQKAECGREHHRRAMLFHEAEKRLLQLEEKHRRSIIKARPYFEVKAQCDQMLATQKERVECLQRAIKDAKTNYASSLRTLEEISNQIHQQRRDYDFIANGPREPGVGAELVSPEKHMNYELEFNQLSNSRINSMANSHLNKDGRSQECDPKDDEQKENTENLGKRSVDGSEATSSQWELELQVSMENLNNLSLENSVYDSDHEHIKAHNLCHYNGEENVKSSDKGINIKPEAGPNVPMSKEFPAHALKHFQKLSKNFQILTRPLADTALSLHVQGLHSLKNDVADSIALNKSKGLKNYLSKSLNSSPINMNASNLEEAKFADTMDVKGVRKYVPNGISKFGFNNQKSRSNNDINLSWNLDIANVKKYQESGSVSDRNDNLDGKTDTQVVNSGHEESCTTKGTSKNDLNSNENCDSVHSSDKTKMISELREKVALNKRPKSNTSQLVSLSASASPVKLKSSSNLPTTKSLDNTLADGFKEFSPLKTLTSKMSNIRELPLLSLFEKNNTLVGSKSKSCSMINLDDKQSLMILLDNSHLDNIQAVSAERLANARDNLFRKVPR